MWATSLAPVDTLVSPVAELTKAALRHARAMTGHQDVQAPPTALPPQPEDCAGMRALGQGAQATVWSIDGRTARKVKPDSTTHP
jgi:hypothetical protein